MNRVTVLLLGLLALLIPALTTAVILADLSPEARAEVTAVLSSQVVVLAVGLLGLVGAIVGVAYGSYRTAKRRDEAIAAEVDMMVRANPGHRLIEDSQTAHAVNRLADQHQRAEDRLAEQLAAAHEELQSERDDLVEVLAGLDVPIGVIDSQGRILLVNPAARGRLGGALPVAAGRSIYSVFDAHDFAPLVAAALAGERPTAIVGDTLVRLVQISAPLPDHGTEQLARILIVGDVDDSDAAMATSPELGLSSDLGRRHTSRTPQADWPSTSLADLVFTVVDCETTGLHVAAGDRLVAVAAVRVDSLRVRTEDTFDMLTNPGRSIPEVSREIHGISEEMVADAPPPGDVVAAFGTYAAESILVGHHLGFDLGFLTPVAQRTNVPLPSHGVDTMLLSAVLFPAADTHHGLDALCQRLGVPIIGRHTALGDALATAEVLVRMIPMLAERGIITLADARAACEQTELARRIAPV